MHWDRWLEELRALPAEAQEWDGIAAFVAALYQLAAVKQQERESRGRLRQALTTLVTHCADELVFFSMADASAWTADSCLPAETFTLMARVEQFQSTLTQYRDLRQQPVTNVAEDRRRRKALDDLDEQITQQHDSLMTALLPSEASPQLALSSISTKEGEYLEDVPGESLPSPSALHATSPVPMSSLSLTVPENPKVMVDVQPEKRQQYQGEHLPPLTATNGSGPTVTVEEPAPLPVPKLTFRSSQEVATLLQSDDRDEQWQALLWTCIAEDDLPMAYWLVQSLQAAGRAYSVPAWLLAAVQGARWLSPHSADFVAELRDILLHQPDTDETKLLGLAAALRLALLIPDSRLVSWLTVPDCCPVLQSLVSAVTTFVQLGKELRLEDWGNVEELRVTMSQAFPEVHATLTALSCSTQSTSLAAAAHCLHRSVGQLCEVLRLSPSLPSAELPLTKDWDWLPFGTRSLSVALSRRLLWLPEIPLENDGQPPLESLPRLASLLRDTCATTRSLGDAFDRWLHKQDYRFVDILLHVLHRSEPDFSTLSRRYQEALAHSRTMLRDQVWQTLSAIEQAVIDGVIVDERTRYIAAVEAILPEETLHFAPQHASLQQVQEDLANARQQRLVDLQATWHGLRTRLAESAEPTKWEKISASLQAAADRSDIRMLEEDIARLAATLEAESSLEEDWSVPAPLRDPLAEFLEVSPHIEGWMEKEVGLLQPIATDIRQGRPRAGIAFGELPTSRLKEASVAIETWRHLKQRKAQGDHSVQAIAQLLRYLGFTLDPGTATALQREQHGGDWIQVRAHMSADGVALAIPQLGSQAQRRYEVACVWQRPGVDTLSAWLRDARHEARSAIVLYLGRLTARQRRELMLKARDQDLALMVLDETLLVFLAGERDSRLPIFFRCTLPFAVFHPYTPPQPSEVPPEMFFGRKALICGLQHPQGSCLVYGGRQTGKTALLRHVQREFHHPEREHYAWVESLKSMGSASDSSPAPALWLKLRDGCKAAGVLTQKVTTDKPEEIARSISEALRTAPERRLLVLYDDADHCLEADAKDRFRVVEGLRKLMADTQRRLKVVFAGSSGIQRFHKMPYQPLAPFGDPLVVGPLEPDAARQLVSEPFAALGYRFADTMTLLRILSYTNYHPALLQLFCHELLSKLQERTSGDPPPYLIESTDVEEVYRSRKVRDGIREQFDSTLALDARYQVLTWTMLVEQQKAGDGDMHLHTPGVLWQIAQQWWPRELNHAGEDQVRDLLEEMRGLGILSRTVNGQYRLRNPNLLRLLGTDFEDRLLKLAQA